MKCFKCGRELDGVTLEFTELQWQCAECSSDPSDSIFCRRGDRIRYSYPQNGTQSAQMMAKKYLTPGDAYVVDEIKIGRSYSYIKVQGLKYWFNSVLFERLV